MNKIIVKYKNMALVTSEGNMNNYILNTLI